jgi:hypothetical protein
MRFNFLDILVAGAALAGMLRGRRRGLALELPQLIGLLAFVLTGSTLAGLTRGLLAGMSVATGRSVGLAGLVGLFIVSTALARRFRAELAAWAARKYPAPASQKRLGGLAGGLRGLIIGSTLIVFCGLLPIGVAKKPFADGSFIGRHLIRWVVPVYDKLTGQPPAAPKDAPRQPPRPGPR